MPELFIISGCNGAGKTTASFTFLPELLNIKEFVNADEIARGISPFQPDKVAIEAGKIMLKRIRDLVNKQESFAFETTLSTRSFVHFIDMAKQRGYIVNLIYFWLDSVELAYSRVHLRVSEGGHDIPKDVIKRRYHSGIRNFLTLYKNKVDNWAIIDNSSDEKDLIARYSKEKENVYNANKWLSIQKIAYEL